MHFWTVALSQAYYQNAWENVYSKMNKWLVDFPLELGSLFWGVLLLSFFIFFHRSSILFYFRWIWSPSIVCVTSAVMRFCFVLPHGRCGSIPLVIGLFYCHVGIDLHTLYVPFLYADASHDRMKAARLGEFINRNLLDFVSSNRNRNRRIYCLCKLEHLIFHFTQTVMYIWRSSCFVIIFLTLTKFDST